MIRYHTYVIANATTPTQVAIANFMKTPEARKFVETIRDEFQRRRDVIVNGFNSLSGITCQKPEGSFYCYPDISATPYPNCEEFSNKAFDDLHVVVVPGTEFGPTQTHNIRASFGSTNIDQINEVMERLARIL
jgi:aspartate/methionine/tyrosine aminotransferase